MEKNRIISKIAEIFSEKEEEEKEDTRPVLLMDDISSIPKGSSLVKTIEASCTKDELVRICNHLKEVSGQYRIRLRKDPEKHVKSMEMLLCRQISKHDLAIPVANIVCIPENFKAYISLLDNATQQLWALLYLYYYQTPDQVNEKTGRRWYFSQSRSYYGTSYETNFSALCWIKKYNGYYYSPKPYLYLPEYLWKAYHNAIGQDSFARDIEEKDVYDALPDAEGLVTYSNESNIGNILNVIQQMEGQGLLEFGVNKMALSTIKKAQKQLQMPEFFPEEKALLACSLAIPYLTEFVGYDSGSMAKYYEKLQDAIHTTDMEFIVMEMLSHMKGLRRDDIIYESHYEDIYNMVSDVLKGLSMGKWYGVTNIEKRVSLHKDASFDVLSFMSRELIDSRNITDANSAAKKVSLCDVHDYFTRPLIMGYLALFASLGLVEVAYSKNASDRVGKYSFIEYVRITKLGAYVLGQTKEYQADGIHMPYEYFSADDAHLIILSKDIDGSNPYEGLLSNIAEPIGAHRYRVTPETYLKGCTCAEDLESKRKFFLDNVSSRSSALWKNFFDDMLKRCNPLKNIGVGYTLKQISADNKELQRLFTTDSYLRKHTLRAENYIVLIETKSMNKVKEILAGYGYLI